MSSSANTNGKQWKKKLSQSKKLRYERERRKQRGIADSRILELFRLADRKFEKDPQLAKRYVAIARKISMKYNAKIPSEFKRKFCKKCGSYLRQGKNVTVRIKNSHMVYHCHECGAVSRIGYKSKSRKKAAANFENKSDKSESN